MTPVFLAAVNFGVLIMLAISAYLGWGEPDPDALFTHMYWGVATSFLGLFGHSFTLFFFVGTGKAVKEACREHQPAWGFIGLANRYKRVVAGRAMLANLMLIVLPILGAAVYSGRLSGGWHTFGFWVTLIVQAWVFATEMKYLGLNNVLLDRVSHYKDSGEILIPEAPP